MENLLMAAALGDRTARVVRRMGQEPLRAVTERLQEVVMEQDQRRWEDPEPRRTALVPELPVTVVLPPQVDTAHHQQVDIQPLVAHPLQGVTAQAQLQVDMEQAQHQQMDMEQAHHQRVHMELHKLHKAATPSRRLHKAPTARLPQ